MDRLAPDAISWAPSRRIFLRRVMISSLVTFGALAAAGIAFSTFTDLSYGFGAALAVALILTLGFVVEDISRWRAARTDLWQISEGQLIHDGEEGRSVIPLSEVQDVRLQFGGRVSVKLSSGQRVVLRFLPFPQQTAEQIIAATGRDPGQF